MNAASEQRLIEKVEILDGSRSGKIRHGAAVRIGDMVELLQLQPIQTKKLSSPPTAEQYNALLNEIVQLHNRLQVISDALAKRIRG